MKFKYRKFPLDQRSEFFGASLLKPVIPISIAVGGGRQDCFALIDSGADFCIFDAEIGELLGLEIEPGSITPFGGIQESSQRAIAYLHEVKLSIGGGEYEARVGFSRDISLSGIGVLGQRGFFDHYTVIFDLTKEVIKLEPTSS